MVQKMGVDGRRSSADRQDRAAEANFPTKGVSCEEITAEEGVGRERNRGILSEGLETRSVSGGADSAERRLDRLAPAAPLGAEAVAPGGVSSIAQGLEALDRLDRYPPAT